MAKAEKKARKSTSRKAVKQPMDLVQLFSKASPSVLGFINKLSVGGSKPHFPTIFGTGFFVDASGIAATNRHVIEMFHRFPPNPKTGESSLAAVLFFPEDDGSAWQLIVVDLIEWNALAQFSSSSTWYGQTVPDIGFVQIKVRNVPALKLAAEEFYLRIGMDIATIGYPMGNLPMTVLGKLNQVSPFLRHGIVSSVFPCPTKFPHGLTIDIMQQGGSSGSPVLRVTDGVVVGMMSSGVLEWRLAQPEEAGLAYSTNTNISIAEPSHIIQKALVEFRAIHPIDVSSLPTLAERRAEHPKPDKDTGLTWDSWIQS
jgi:S1-C subfamily serine protease